MPESTVSTSEYPVVRARFGEEFTLPRPNLPASIAPIWSNNYLPVANYELEITVGEDRLITGSVEVSGLMAMFLDPYDQLVGRHSSSNLSYFIVPFGTVPIEYTIVEDDENGEKNNRGLLTIAKLPLVIAIRTNPLDQISSRDFIDIRHFVIATGRLISGGRSRIDKTTTTRPNDWYDYNNKGSILLPYKAAVFDEIKIVVGDQTPRQS